MYFGLIVIGELSTEENSVLETWTNHIFEKIDCVFIKLINDQIK